MEAKKSSSCDNHFLRNHARPTRGLTRLDALRIEESIQLTPQMFDGLLIDGVVDPARVRLIPLGIDQIGIA
jgi:hypothetical protein